MNGISVIILSLAAVMHVSGECVDYSPHPNGNCKAFIRCVDNISYEMTCGEGTVFNPAYNVCDWPQNVNCPSGKTTALPEVSTAVPNVTTATPEKTTAEPETTTAAAETTTAAAETTTAAAETTTAAAETTTATAETTTAAVEATTNATAAPTEPTTTAENVVTTPASEVTTEANLFYPPCPNITAVPGKYPDLESGCHSYYVCNNGKVTKEFCPPGLLYEIWTQYCQVAQLVPSCKLM